ncbi:meiotically upregulated Mug5 [Schizosaccharomyces cryophilus OY26]|uniref:Meiotically upregulated Mug5 n=1 Tax=Schizosaccharomyces cryophilus (strain OY26 / ATCC MYA-4695 / CBS 11777 / NBRC 106824 / NRRL Y48691) TaxID=653667 RepID=S9X8P0_SCHCR|nr:meiotically upregulated Mug5 [Schizosaccharomyces cryophilus OY26]EPY50191.1 meiotically upregulated Mug5 [Schizosaccharomyces cryophilus OY26]
MLTKTLLENLEKRLKHLELILSFFDPNQMKYLCETEVRLLESSAYHELYNEHKSIFKSTVSCSEKENLIFEPELSNLDGLMNFFNDTKRLVSYEQKNFVKDFIIFLNEQKVAAKQFLRLRQLLSEHHEMLKRTVNFILFHYIEPMLLQNHLLLELSLRLRKLEKRVAKKGQIHNP